MSLQGRVYLGKRDANGNPEGLRAIGNVSNLQINMSVDKLEHFESQSGQRLKDLELIRQKSATLSMTAEEWSPENIALGLYGTTVKVEGGTGVTGEQVGGTTLAVGERFSLAYPNVSDVVVADSTPGTPLELVEGVDYTVDKRYGAIQLLRAANDSAAPFVAPLVVAYMPGESTQFGLFTQPTPERFMRFEGVNTADNNAPVIVELYRATFDPVSNLSLITNELNTFELGGAVLADLTKPVDAVFGQFGKFVMV
jgi:hypothetical protein